MSAQVLAVDIGGTKLAAGLVDEDGRVLASDRTPTLAGADGERRGRDRQRRSDGLAGR